MDNYIEIQHVSLIVSDTKAALAFYCDVLGMQEAARADLPYPGAWLQVGEQQIHLLELPNPDPASMSERPEHGGRDRHTAITVKDVSIVTQQLEQAGITYTTSRSGRKALFFRDPDGNAIELLEEADQFVIGAEK